jgi:DNA-binding NarL/FixJ family response regulator
MLQQAPKRVFIVDDSSIVRNIIKTFLSEAGNLEVCGEAFDGLDAVEKVTAFKPDVILLDFAMPRMNGADAACELKRLMPETPIILFTMYSESIGNSVTSPLAVDAVLSKPDGITALVNAVDAVLARKSALKLKNSEPKS